MDKRKITMLCVAIAGLIFVPTVYFNYPLFALIGAFFDWLPLPTGWMRFGGKINKKYLYLHISTTLIAYVFFIAWLVLGLGLLGFIFLEIWWVAVVFGVLMTG